MGCLRDGYVEGVRFPNFAEPIGRVASVVGPILGHLGHGLRGFTEFTVNQPFFGLVEEIDQILLEPFIDVTAGQQTFSDFVFFVFNVVLGIFFLQLKELFEVFYAIITDI
jgi:hypothetical protein